MSGPPAFQSDQKVSTTISCQRSLQEYPPWTRVFAMLHPWCLFPLCCGSKIGTPNGRLANGNMDSNLGSRSGLILTHTHLLLASPPPASARSSEGLQPLGGADRGAGAPAVGDLLLGFP